MKKLLIFLLLLAIVIATPVVINILQNGLGGPDGRSMDDILGKNAAKATADDVEALTKSEFMQLFYAAEAPRFNTMNGEYESRLLDKGVLEKAVSFFTHSLMGPGRWNGLAFTPATRTGGWGYNMFSIKRGSETEIARLVKMDTYEGPSVFDDKESFCVTYEKYNLGMLNSMQMEIRQINHRLFVGYFYLNWGGGQRNPAPFVLIGPPKPWEGVDGD